jgi:hypothetical protein
MFAGRPLSSPLAAARWRTLRRSCLRQRSRFARPPSLAGPCPSHPVWNGVVGARAIVTRPLKDHSSGDAQVRPGQRARLFTGLLLLAHVVGFRFRTATIMMSAAGCGFRSRRFGVLRRMGHGCLRSTLIVMCVRVLLGRGLCHRRSRNELECECDCNCTSGDHLVLSMVMKPVYAVSAIVF